MIETVSSFKDRLNIALELRNMNPVDLARKAHISESTVSQYRSGYAKPKEDRLADIANALNVNPAWLMGLNVDMYIEPTLPDEHTKILLEYAKKLKDISITATEHQLVQNYRDADEIDKKMVNRILNVKEVD